MISAQRNRHKMEDTILIYNLEKGFGEFFWNTCAICGGASIRTTIWEDGSEERGDCLICKRMFEIMELEDSLTAGSRDN